MGIFRSSAWSPILPGGLHVFQPSANALGESSSDSCTAELSAAVIQAWGRSRIRIGTAKARRRGSRIGSERGSRIIERWKRRDGIIGGRSGRSGERTKVRLIGDGLLVERDDRSGIYGWQTELGRTDQGSGCRAFAQCQGAQLVAALLR